MKDLKIYEDISKRTGGDIYIGIVGPVRTGKSTFIKRFMETLVIPNIEDEFMRERAKDELPQSGSGRTIMTAEPKFVPEDAVRISVDGEAELSVRLIDCVGYMVDGAAGFYEEGSERMVSTPWNDEPVSITEAAEVGTYKVISEHSTIGIVITSDGTVTDIEREGYIKAEERVITELKQLGKPFLLLINSADPKSEASQLLRNELSEKYGVTAIVRNCLTLEQDDITEILRSVLYEFSVVNVGFFLPPWLEALPVENELYREILKQISESANSAALIRDCIAIPGELMNCENISSASLDLLELGTGNASIRISVPRELFYEAVSHDTGFEITDDGDLITLLKEMASVKQKYDRIADALSDAEESGYGIVMPSADELKLEEPEIVKQGGNYSVKLKAGATSIHMIRTDVVTEVSPAVGGEKSSATIVNFLLQEFDGDTSRIWESNLFGKSLYDIAGEGLESKLRSMSEDTRDKIREMLCRVINEGANGLVCFII